VLLERSKKSTGQACVVGEYPKNHNVVTKRHISHAPKAFVVLRKECKAAELFQQALANRFNLAILYRGSSL
jgi:hypothetical protein